MSCKKCGKRTTRSRLCVDCGKEKQRESTEWDFEWYDCPECGRDTSGKGVVCYRCR